VSDKIKVAEAFKFLGLEPTAGFVEVSHACKDLNVLYGAGGLATYSLLNEEERSCERVKIDSAYRVLTAHFTDKQPLDQATPPVNARHYHVESAVSPAAFLRECREHDGVSLQSVAVQSKIGTTHLENIETECYERLPAPVYLRGFIVEFARQLGVANPDELTREYLQRMVASAGEK
jgi:hypothetical protein